MAKQKLPIEVIKARGRKHLTKSEIAEREAGQIKANFDKIRAPSYLTKEQKKEFKNVSNELKKIGILSNLDCDALARFLEHQSQWIEITEQLRKTQMMIKEVREVLNLEGETIFKEFEVVNPEHDKLMRKQEKQFALCRLGASDFGLTITSRCKLVIPKTEEKTKNKFNKFAK